MMKALRSRGLSLIAQESFVERFDRFVAHGLGTERTHDFGSPLHIEHATSVEHTRFHHSRHVFAFRGKGKFHQRLGTFAQRAVVARLTVKPEQQSALCGVAQHGGVRRIAQVERRRAVHRDAFGDESALFVRAELLIGQRGEGRFGHRHAVLGQRSGFVGANYGRGAHGFASMHLAHEVARTEHAAHGVGQTEGHGHRQTFGYGHHNHRHGNHDRAEQVGGKVHPLETDRLASADKVHDHAAHNDEHGQDVADVGDQVAQTVELLVERCFHTVVDLCGLKHFAAFGGVADCQDAANAVSGHHLRAAQHVVGGESGFGVKIGLDRGLGTEGFAGQGRFVDGELHRFEQLSVGRDVVARADHHDVAHHDVTFGHLDRVALTNHAHRLFVVHLVEDLKFLIGFELEVEGQSRRKQHGDKDTYRFEKDRGFLVETEELVARDEQREDACDEQDDDDRILKLFEETLPKRGFLRGSEDVHTVARTAFLHFARRKPVVVFGFGHDGYDLIVISQ